MDEPLRLRMDLDLRGPDQAAVGVARSGPAPDAGRLSRAALLLATGVATAALEATPAEARADAAERLEALGPAGVADLLRGRGSLGGGVSDLPPGAQVGARGVCGRLVLHPGTPPDEALVSVDIIGLEGDRQAGAWLARAPMLVPRLLSRAGCGDPDTLARALVALRALGRAARTAPDRLGEPRLARRLVDEALTGEPVALAAELRTAQMRAAAGAAADPPPAPTAPMPQVPPPPGPGAGRRDDREDTVPLARVSPPRAPDRERRLLVLVVTALAVGAVTAALLLAVLISPGTFGVGDDSGVRADVGALQDEVSAMRRSLDALEASVQQADLARVRVDLVQASARLDQLEAQMNQLCGVLPLVC